MSEVAVIASPEPSGTVYAIIGQTVPANRIDAAIGNPDALRVAYDVGVLELLSLGLTLLGIVLALAAVFGFWAIRGAAVQAARRAAKEEIKDIATKQAQKWIEEHGKEILAQYGVATAGAGTPTLPIDRETEAQVIAGANEVRP